jgi:hypothetical protein
MNKQLVAFVLWFYLGWTVGAVLTFMFGINGLVGPILGVALASVIVGAPLSARKTP